MTVIVANDTPAAIRGTMKRWFIEPRPNVFVGTLNQRTHRKVIEYVLRNAPDDFGMLVISSAPNCQGYVIERHGPAVDESSDGGRRDVADVEVAAGAEHDQGGGGLADGDRGLGVDRLSTGVEHHLGRDPARRG